MAYALNLSETGKETIKIDSILMAQGYMAMALINLEEANAGIHTYMDEGLIAWSDPEISSNNK